MKKYFWIFSLIFLLALAVRLPDLGQFMTADESNWMIRSGEFWHNLFLNGDPGGTFRTTHPGVITMWLSGGGVFFQEMRLGHHIDQSNLAEFRFAATLPLAVATAWLVAVVALQCVLLFPNRKYMWLGGVILALDPYLTGMSQIVHVDALLSLFMLNALLATLRFVGANDPAHRRKLLLMAGLFTAGSALNKFFPSLWLWPIITVILFFHTRGFFYQRVRRLGVQLLFLLGVVGVTAVLLWPALTVAGDLTRSFVRDGATVATTEHVDISQTENANQAYTFYGLTWLTRTPPFTMILGGATFVVLLVALYKQRKVHPFLYLAGYSLTYLVFISLVAKKADRYALPAITILPLLAGLGMASAVDAIKQAQFISHHRFLTKVIFIVIGLALAAQTITVMPYAIAYNNPFFDVRPLSQQGWGEGLDGLANFLNRQPLGKKLVVASWYPSIFATYYHGDTYSLSSRDDKRVGLVVLYRNMQGRGSDDEGTNIWDEFKDKKPKYVFSIQGKPYVLAYEIVRLHYFPRITGELIQDTQVGQIIPVEKNNWSRIDLGLATYSGRANTHDVVLHIRSGINSSQDIRTIHRSATDIIDGDWNQFSFEPIPNSAGQSYYVFLTSPDSTPGNAITVRYIEKDIRPGQMVWRRRTDKASADQNSFLQSGDLAYQIP